MTRSFSLTKRLLWFFLMMCIFKALTLEAVSCGVEEERGENILEKLRQENFNKAVNARLHSHPFVLAAEDGELSLTQRRAFAGEQYAVQKSDAASFAVLAGYKGFSPTSLATATLPELEMGGDKLFQFLLQGELEAAPLLLAHGASLGFKDEAALGAYQTSSKAQGFPSYVARLALTHQRAATAAAAAINFPAWSSMCKRVRVALADPKLGYNVPNVTSTNDESLAFLAFFENSIKDLDLMAIAIIEEEAASYEDIVDHVRLLQEYEVDFWDAVFEADYDSR
jgi:hypothetical protein